MAQTVEAIFWSGNQDMMDYTPSGSAVVAGQVFGFPNSGLERLAAVALSPIAVDEKGALCIEGHFKFKKKAGVAFGYGEEVAWDDGQNEAVNDADANKDWGLGRCVYPALAGDDFVIVKINCPGGYSESA